MEKNRPPQVSQVSYYWVSPIKFVLMALCTLGFYYIYWNYKNWCYIKEQDQSKISPVWRSIFYPLWYFSLLSDLGKRGKSVGLTQLHIKIILASAVLILSSIAVLSDPYSMLSSLIFIPFLPPVIAITEINKTTPAKPASLYHHKVNFVTYLVGGPIVFFTTLSVIGFFPSTKIVEGNELWGRDINFLRAENILGDTEEILYFYSDAIVSIKSDGQFISNEYVTSYYTNPDNGLLIIEYEKYEEISNIQVLWAERWLDNTVVTILNNEGGSFELWLSAEGNGDRLFVENLKRLWNNKNKKAANRLN